MILSAFGFNQPFFFTLIGIILILLLTLALVGDANEDECKYSYDSDFQFGPDAIVLNTPRTQFHLIRKKSYEKVLIKQPGEDDPTENIIIC